jgi:hypothetical protein
MGNSQRSIRGIDEGGEAMTGTEVIPEAVRLRFLSERILRLLSCPQSFSSTARSAVANDGLAFLGRAARGEYEADVDSFKAAEPENLAAAEAVVDAFLLAPAAAPQDVQAFRALLEENEEVLRAVRAGETVEGNRLGRAKVFFRVLQDYSAATTTAPFDTAPVIAIGR